MAVGASGFRDAEHTAPGQLPIRNTQDQWPKVGDDTELAFLRSTEAQARTIPTQRPGPDSETAKITDSINGVYG